MKDHQACVANSVRCCITLFRRLKICFNFLFLRKANIVISGVKVEKLVDNDHFQNVNTQT